MSTTSLSLFPSCTQCHAVMAQGIWSNEGKTLKTTKKLSSCTRCYLDRYCNAKCQKEHWSKHSTNCVTSEKIISSSEVDKIVRDVCSAKSGKVKVYLDSENKFLHSEESSEEASKEELTVEVYVQNKKIRTYSYLVCSKEKKEEFDWKSKLNEILHPKNGIHNPLAQVELAHEMIAKGLYKEAFQMMAEKTPKHYSFLIDMFFPKAIKDMHAKGVDLELIKSYAAFLKKNATEVSVLLNPPEEKALPKELQSKIDGAKQLSYGKRDVEMESLTRQVAQLGLYDQAFDLVFNWIAFDYVKISFFRFAADTMIAQGIAYDKIVQLAKKINLKEHQIISELVGIYPKYGKTKLACELAQKSNKQDYYLEIVFSALLNISREEEAKEILKLVSEDKRSDLEFFLRK